MNVGLVVIVQMRVHVFVSLVSLETNVNDVQPDSLGQIVNNANAQYPIKVFVMMDWRELEIANAIQDLMGKIVINVPLVSLVINVKVRIYLYLYIYIFLYIFTIQFNSYLPFIY